AGKLRELRRLVPDPAPVLAYQFAPQSQDPANLREGGGKARFPVKLNLVAPRYQKANREIRALFADGDWLDVEPLKLEGEGPWDLPVSIHLKENAERSLTPPPQGFLLQARVNGRAF